MKKLLWLEEEVSVVGSTTDNRIATRVISATSPDLLLSMSELLQVLFLTVIPTYWTW